MRSTTTIPEPQAKRTTVILKLTIGISVLLICAGVGWVVGTDPSFRYATTPRNVVLVVADGLTYDHQLLFHVARQGEKQPITEWERRSAGAFVLDPAPVGDLLATAYRARKAIGIITTGDLLAPRHGFLRSLRKQESIWDQALPVDPVLLVGGGLRAYQDTVAPKGQAAVVLTSPGAWHGFSWEGADRVMAILSPGDLPYTIDAPHANKTTLRSLLGPGLQHLRTHGAATYDGFFLVVHVTAVEQAIRENDFGALFHEIAEIDGVLHTLREYAESAMDTLVISIGYPTGQEEFVADTSLLPDVLRNKASLAAAKRHPKDATLVDWLLGKFTLDATSRYATSLAKPGLAADAVDRILSNMYTSYYLMTHAEVEPKRTATVAALGNTFMLAPLYTTAPKDRTVQFIEEFIRTGLSVAATPA